MALKMDGVTILKNSKLDNLNREMHRLVHCELCGAKLLLNHISDYKSLVIHESAQCLDCGKDNRKIIHMIN